MTAPQSPPRPVDLRWAELSASRRGRTVYVKMPVEKARAVIFALDRILGKEGDSPQGPYLTGFRNWLQELVRDTFSAGQRSLVYSLPASETVLLVENLQAVEADDDLLHVEGLRKVSAAGLRGDQSVDWISRMGGPPPDEVERARLVRQAKAAAVEVDLSELFEDPPSGGGEGESCDRGTCPSSCASHCSH